MEMSQEHHHHHHHNWPVEEEFDGEEQQLSLRAKQKRPPNDNGNGHGDEEKDELEREIVAKELSDHRKTEEKAAIDDDLAAAAHFEVIGCRNTIYFDDQQGTESTHGAVESSVIAINNGNGLSHANESNFELQDHSTENVEDGSFSDLDLPTLDNSCYDNNSSFKNFADIPQVNEAFDLVEEISQEITELDVEKTLQKQDVEIIEEVDEEIIDLNVENVIAKQNTHDLLCPNCNKCITRTVILRKRKPKIKMSRKKEKVTTVVKTTSGQSPPEHVIEELISTPIYSNDSSQADDDRPDKESIIFKCLSCFSIFIPIGSGFKVLKNDNENESTQNVEKKRWFPIFFPDKRKNATNQGDGAVVSLEAESSNILQPLLEDSHFVEPLADGTLNIVKQSSENVQIKISQSGEIERTGEILTDSGYKSTIEVRNTALLDQNGNTLANTVALPLAESPWVPQPVNTTANVLSETKIDSLTDPVLIQTIVKNVDRKPDGGMVRISTGDVIVDIEQDPHTSQNIVPSPEDGTLPQLGTVIDIRQQPRESIITQRYGIDILKSIVYGGLIESVTSLGVVASAAGAGASTVDVLALGLANMIGGLFVILHNLRELRTDRTRISANVVDTQEDRYQEVLGRRDNLWIHATIVIISYVIFGLIPPVVYGYSSYKTDVREMKILALFVVSLVCIFLLGIGKAHTRPAPKPYFKTAFYYLSMAILAAGVAFGAGDLIKKLIVKLHLLDSRLSTAVPFLETDSFERTWASY